MVSEHLTPFADTPKTPYLWVMLLVGAAIAVATFAAGEIRGADSWSTPGREGTFDNLLPLDDPAMMSNFTA